VSDARATFRLVSLRSEPAVPPWLTARLLEPGVPEDFLDGHYTVLDVARFEEGAGLGRVSFGSAEWGGRFQIDLDDLKIWVLNDAGNLYPVNSSLDQFSECVRVVTECWPDWSRVDDFDYCEVIATRIRDEIIAVDEFALALDTESFWETFYSDVRIGVYLE
jgi:hypothetical protein